MCGGHSKTLREKHHSPNHLISIEAILRTVLATSALFIVQNSEHKISQCIVMAGGGIQYFRNFFNDPVDYRGLQLLVKKLDQIG